VYAGAMGQLLNPTHKIIYIAGDVKGLTAKFACLGPVVLLIEVSEGD
jgi:hypothetical protein